VQQKLHFRKLSMISNQKMSSQNVMVMLSHRFNRIMSVFGFGVEQRVKCCFFRAQKSADISASLVKWQLVNITVSEGVAVKHLRCCVIFNDHFIANLLSDVCANVWDSYETYGPPGIGVLGGVLWTQNWFCDGFNKRFSLFYVRYDSNNPSCF